MGELLDIVTKDFYKNDFENSSIVPELLFKISELLKIPVEYLSDDYYKFIFMPYGTLLKNWRLKNNLSLKQAASLIKVSPTELANWEKQIVYPNREQFHKIDSQIKFSN